MKTYGYLIAIETDGAPPSADFITDELVACFDNDNNYYKFPDITKVTTELMGEIDCYEEPAKEDNR